MIVFSGLCSRREVEATDHVFVSALERHAAWVSFPSFQAVRQIHKLVIRTVFASLVENIWQFP